MKKIILFVIPLFCFNLIIAQKNAITIKYLPGIGFAGYKSFRGEEPGSKSFRAEERGIGFEFKKNRIEFNYQVGWKKKEESRFNIMDNPVYIQNYTLSYSRLLSKNKFTLTPKLGLGYVSGHQMYEWGPMTTGFGLNYGLGIEYNLVKFLSLSVNYNEALLLSDLTGNRAILGGVIFKISKKDK
tara:strand:- start:43 stop:594 length:552 start_codon:yes stop_codon:yes gene_type:complete